MRRAVIAMALGLSLAGCGDPNADVKAWMAEVAARTKPEVEPLPVLEPPEEFTYAREGIPDPFADRLQEETPPDGAIAQSTGGLAPDPNRPREALEAFPFDALRMVGTLRRDQSLWALIRAPDETVNRVAVGNYLGQNHGRVTAIDDSTVHVVEIIPAANGGWIEREAALAIVELP